MIGLAFSGGGVSAAIAAACACNSLAENFPSLLLERNLTVSTVSGGSIGYALWANSDNSFMYPPSSMSATLEEIMLGGIWGGRTKEPSRAFGDDAPNTGGLPVGKFVGELRKAMLRLAFNRKSFGNETGTHWWQSIVEQIFHTACIENVTVGDLAWKSSYALMGGDAPPTRGGNGALTADSANNLDHVVVEISDEKIRVEQALAHSTSFWAAPILTLNPVVRRLFGNLVHIDQNNSKVLDGGVVDTTGVVNLLGQQSSTILAFYNNNAPLSKLVAPIAYLFGVDAPTDSMNSLLGPKLSQVFPSNLYGDFISNLSDWDIGIAHLSNVEVLKNEKLGIEPYRLKSLVMFSNIKLKRFRFEDPMIAGHLSTSWPDDHTLFPSEIETGALCAYNGWKVTALAEDSGTFDFWSSNFE